MSIIPRINWEDGEHTSFITLNDHQVYVQVCGPNRKLDAPILVLIPGITCSIAQWVKVKQAIQPDHRLFLYDRSGLGYSETYKEEAPRNAIAIAKELDQLLKIMDLKPPYVLLTHSYGGIISREFAHLRLNQLGHENDIVGWVFVDAAQERSVEWWPNADLRAMSDGIDSFEARKMEDTTVLTNEEWRFWRDLEASPRHVKTMAEEAEHYVTAGRELGKKRQLEMDPPLLGDHPISVIRADMVRDMRNIYEAGLATGNGTPAQRERGKKFLEEWPKQDEINQRGILKISSNHHYVRALNSGHNVQFTEPDVIAREVMWVMNNLQK
jgi:pimeloyl-ACP methyl ester carboxylesterase